LSPLVSYAEQKEGYNHNANDGPEVEELGRKNVGVAVRKDREIVPLDIQERKDSVFPAIHQEEFEVLLESVTVDCVCCVDQSEEDVVEKGLEGRDGGTFVKEES
jgi:hypothetical protein